MQGRLAKWMIVAALVVSVGGHWGILQTAAWVGMTVKFSQNSSLSTALEKTFNGKNPCKVCKFVEEGKKTETESEAKLDVKKVELFHIATSKLFFPAVSLPLIGAVAHALPRSEAPPVPPPLLS